MESYFSILPRLSMIALLSFMLVGCSYFDTGEALQVEKPQVVAPQADYNVNDAILQRTNGSVEIFDLTSGDVVSINDVPLYASSQALNDAQAQEFSQMQNIREAAPSQAIAVNEHQNFYTSNAMAASTPNVQIFSLDDDENISAAGWGNGYTPQSLVSPYTSTQPMMREDDIVIQDGVGNRAIVYFEHDSADVHGGEIAKIERISSIFNPAAGQGLTIEGHASVQANYADRAQRGMVNLKISLDRAYNVAREMIARGVPPEAIRVIGRGDTIPVDEVNGMSAEQASRRVEILG